MAMWLGNVAKYMKSRCLFSLCDSSKQTGDERHLSNTVPFASALHLPLPHPVQDFFSLQSTWRTLQGEEVHTRLDEPFEKAVILLNCESTARERYIQVPFTFTEVSCPRPASQWSF
jgi:hypothetical protein